MVTNRLVGRVRVLVSFIFAGGVVSAQTAVTVSGQIVSETSQKPVKAAVVLIEELKRQSTTDNDGRYAFDGVAPGVYHLTVGAPGFTPQRAEVTVTAAPLVVNVAMPAEVHYTEIVSVSPEARDLFTSYQPTAVLAGQELTKTLPARWAPRLTLNRASRNGRSAPDPRARSFAASTGIGFWYSRMASAWGTCPVNPATTASTSIPRQRLGSRWSAVPRRCSMERTLSAGW